MKSFGWARAALLMAATAACSASGGSTSSGSTAPMPGSPCSVDSDCGPSLVCDKSSQGKGACVYPCNGSYGDSVVNGVPTSTACIDGRETACNELPATTCGCSCAAGSYCLVSKDMASGKCVPVLAPGAACTADAACASGACFSCTSPTSCSTGASNGTCSVPLGGPCTYPGTPDCPDCFISGGMGVWCSEGCSPETNGGITTSTCPAGFVCLGQTGAQLGSCYAECTSGSNGCITGTTCRPYVAAQGGVGTGYACQ